MAIPFGTVGQQDKSEAIRQHLAMNPSDSATEVIAALGRLGITASPALVQELRREMAIESAERVEAEQREQHTQQGDGHHTRPASHASREALMSKVHIEDMTAARRFVDELGSIERAREALEAWARFEANATRRRPK